MKELAIGEEIRIRCVESKDSYCCDKCVFNPGDNPCMVEYVCDKGMRKDYTNVHFELVETTEPSAPTRLTTNQKIDIINSFYTCQDKWVAKRAIEMVEEILNIKNE